MNKKVYYVFGFKDGSMQECTTVIPRGVRNASGRPIVLYYNDILLDNRELDYSDVVQASHALHFSKAENIKPMYEGTGRYLVKGEKLVEVLRSNVTGEMCIKLGSALIWYREELDGEPLDEDTARGMYPEYFV